MSNHVPSDRELRGAARALDGDLIFSLEEVLGLLAPGAENRQNAVERATAVKAKSSGIEDLGFLHLFEPRDSGGVDGLEPLLIEIGLSGEEDVSFIGKAKGAAGPFLGSAGEVFNPSHVSGLIYSNIAQTVLPVGPSFVGAY